MNEQDYTSGMLDRTLLFYNKNTIEKVGNTVFAIAGLGGVGAITAELLARWGVKQFRLLDKNRYDPSNLKRQLFAASKTLCQYKVDAAERIKEINPKANIEMVIKDSVDPPFRKTFDENGAKAHPEGVLKNRHKSVAHKKVAITQKKLDRQVMPMLIT